LHLLDLTLPTVEDDLALDESLLIEVEESRLPPLLRLWERPQIAVVLGASCRISDDVFVERCLADGVPIARRSSGGGTVLVGPGALNVSVILPRDFAPGLEAVDVAQSYVLERLASMLRRRNSSIEVRGSGDLAIGDRKVSGSAQRRLKHHFLVHATVLYDFDLSLMPHYLRDPIRQPEYRRGRRHDEFLANLPMTSGELRAAVVESWGPISGEVAPSAIPADAVARLVSSKFGDRSWLWRL
jgi:lipoate-protein ligase A